MDGRTFLDLLSRIVGVETASRLALRFGALDAAVLPGGMTGVEALAVHACVAEESCRTWLTAQFSSLRPSRDATAFGATLDSALSRLPPHRVHDGLVFFGLSSKRPAALARRYEQAGEAELRGPTFASLRPDAARAGNVLFLVRSRSARLLWHVTDSADVDEVLFPCNRRFRVEAVKAQAGRAVILLAEGPFALALPPTERERAAMAAFFGEPRSCLSLLDGASGRFAGDS